MMPSRAWPLTAFYNIGHDVCVMVDPPKLLRSAIRMWSLLLVFEGETSNKRGF
jgi:hypothetical protein